MFQQNQSAIKNKVLTWNRDSKEMKSIILILSLLGFVAHGETARVRALLLDASTGEPITGRVVSVSFGNINMWGHSVTSEGTGITDENGYCSFKGSTNARRVTCTYWRSEDYYRCEAGAKFTGVSLLPYNRLLPDNQVITLAVQRVEHPIPLHIDRLITPFGQDMFKDHDNRLEYDLLTSDWLPPLGTGMVADVVFIRKPRVVFRTGPSKCGHKIGDFYREEMEVVFPGRGNGVQEVKPLNTYLPIRMAPEDGYGPSCVASQWTDDNLQLKHSWGEEEKFYCFRIRSGFDESGKIISGIYGKIYNGLRIVYSGNDDCKIGGVDIDFMINPKSLDRNLEWDEQINLNRNEESSVANMLP